MHLVRAAILSIFLLSCSTDRVNPSSNPNSNGGISSNVTRWKVSELVRGGTILISTGNAVSNYISMELNPSGQFISDNGINECNGRFTTDKMLTIDFEEGISCTKVGGDLISYQQFKETLTKDITTFTINGDSTQLTFSRNSETYIKLKRLK